MAWLENWTYRKAVTIDHTYVDENLSNFPLLVKFTNDTDIGTHAMANGYDIRFTTDDEQTLCKYERISWNSDENGADGEFFVRVPLIYGAQNSTIYAYYGKSDAPNVSSPEETFPTTDGWVAVWHLEEAAAPYLDATTNSNDSDAGTYPTQVVGMVGKAQDFEVDSAQYFRTASSSSFDLTVGSFSVWAKIESIGTWRGILRHGGADYEFGLSWENKLHLDIETNSSTYYSISAITDTTAFHYFGFSFENSGTVKHYIDSGLDNTQSFGTITPNTNLMNVGQRYSDQGWDGILDELRISNIVRSDAWFKFEYRNIAEADNEISFGTEEAGEATVTFYNAFKRDIMNGSIDLDTDTIYAMLVSSLYTQDIDSHTKRSNVTNEVSGTGYTAGGAEITSKDVTVNTTEDLGIWSGSDITWSNTTLTCRGAVVYKSTGASTTDNLISFIDFGTDYETSGQDFTLEWTDGEISRAG